MKLHRVLTIILILILTACSSNSADLANNDNSNIEDPTPTISATNTPIPSPTKTPSPTEIPPTSTPEPIPTVVAPFVAEVSVASLGLRSGPSKFFPLLAYYPIGTTVVVSAQIPNSEWVYVTVANSTDDAWKAESNEIGWMMEIFLDIDEKYTGLPFMYYPIDQILVTYVFDTEGHPIDGANVAVSFTEDGISYRQDSFSDSAGVSLTYYPAGFMGKVVNVEIVGVRCDSVIMDNDCKMKDYFYLSTFSYAELPYSGFIDFKYEKSTISLTGYVINQFGNRVANVQVRGSRADGAYSMARSDQDGNFIMLIGDGDWDIFTRSYDPTVDGTYYSLNTSEGIPENIIITAP